jgi:ubiquinone/menaquinone biosynthesis C-methylase UbiE
MQDSGVNRESIMALTGPVENDSIDVVISNGVLNLTSDKVKAFSEIVRVLRSGRWGS